MDFLQKQGVKFPRGWSARSRCRPEWEDQKKSVEGAFEKMRERVEKKCAEKTVGKAKTDSKKLEKLFEVG